MPLSPGTHLGPYEITGLLGSGGMGEVYRPRDKRLERTVAVKILPAQLSADPIRKQRFEREAKTISSLNHPHICVLHDVEGETLSKRLEKGSLPLDQVLKVGREIADALDRAHRSGVVHRDLKPGNIMLTSAGAKLLDFGLAKPAVALASAATLTAVQAAPVTEEGTIVGTFQYMSPEQVEGKEVDGRSDIFSLGAVLYEMVTGKRAFEGKSQLSVASAILEKEPEPISATKPMTPPALDHAIKKCLAKLPDERWQSASDLASELKWITEDGSQAGPAVRAIAPEKIQRALPWLMAGVLAGAAIVGAVRWPNSKPPEQTLYFSASFPLPAHDIAIAPNGHTLAVVSYHESARKNVVWICELGSQSARYLADTEGATCSFWSPDSRSIGFFADGKLKRIDVSGGPVQTICDAPSGRGGTWNRDGVIAFTPDARQGGGLYRVSASGGTPTQINSPDPSRAEQLPLAHVFARWNPLPVYGGEFYGPEGSKRYLRGIAGFQRKTFHPAGDCQRRLRRAGLLAVLPG